MPFSHLVVRRHITHLVRDFLFETGYKLFCIMIQLCLWHRLILGIDISILRLVVNLIDSSSHHLSLMV